MAVALENKRVGVVGLGKSGIAAVELCLARVATVLGLDEAGQLSESAQKLVERGMALSLGPLDAAALCECDLVVVSPGMPPREALAQAEAAGVEVIGELELASRFTAAPIVLIGGTNGKSTVTALVGAMAEAAGKPTFVGGNFGEPLSRAVLTGDAAGQGAPELLVVEISSFQAERVPTLRASVHALLNVTEDHLDRYASFEDYAAAKGNPFVNMTAADVAVIPHGDSECARQAARGDARVITFSLTADVGDVSPDAEGKHIVDRLRGLRLSRDLSRLGGSHNVANIAAAIAIASALELSEDSIAEGLRRFGGLPHRSVRVASLDGVAFYNDSKATNVGAAVAALAGIEERKAVLIAGGRDKRGAYDPLVAALADKGRAMVLIGEAADRLAEAAEGVVPIVRASSMTDAVARARTLAEPGDAVLLSPACSSYDMFSSYAARGDAFVAAVRAQGDDDE
jgi:UDP-N-acetylmuramoylalanine--D-glutamate ligase